MKRESIFVFILIVGLGCKKPYNPSATTTDYRYLVVEGVINTGPDSTIIKLSRTVPIGSNASSVPETGATVSVESDQGASYSLAPALNGRYVSGGLNLDNTRRYRLHIKTGGKEYLSDFVDSKVSPAIDSVGFSIRNGNLDIYSNAHDVSNNTRYYRWEYTETYIYEVPFISYYQFCKDTLIHGRRIDTILPRPIANSVYECWITNNSSDVIVNSSAKLTNDVIFQNPIATIPLNSEKLVHRYSILLKQYALSAAAFSYYQNLKKNTEKIGSIFDTQPSELASNIHCISDASEPVIGYISAGTITPKRIFIDNKQLPTIIASPPDCNIINLSYCRKDGIPDVIKFGNETPIKLVGKGYDAKNCRDTAYNYEVATSSCSDCTLRGTNKQPSFWQ